MYTLKIENLNHKVLTLTQNEDKYQILSIVGLNPPSAQINRSVVAGMDGSKYNSSKLLERNIVITMKINGDIEKNRIELYSYFNSKQWCKVYYKNESRNVYIEGYVETVEVDMFTSSEIMQISIICPNPYFKALDEIIDDVSKIIPQFKFPFSHGAAGATCDPNPNTDNAIAFSIIDLTKITNVKNESESSTGVIVTIDFVKSINKLLIRNIVTGEEIVLRYDFIANDRLIIDTNKGNKSLKLIRNNQEINIFNYLLKGSVFFQLAIGDNLFSYLADDGSDDDGVIINFRHYTIYGGV